MSKKIKGENAKKSKAAVTLLFYYTFERFSSAYLNLMNN